MMDGSKKNPEIVEELSNKLIEAKDEDDVAEALVQAKLKTDLVFTTDPVQKKQFTDEAKIVVCFVKTDLKAQTEEDDAEEELENAETEEDVEKIVKKVEEKANDLEGKEIVKA